MKKLHLLLTLAVISTTAFAQKLPVKQESSVYAPSTIKLDGKITEWGNLQAYNPATEIFYTMANDGDKLYLICSSTVKEAIQKIQQGGITLTISSTDKNSAIEPLAVTYPIVPWVNAQVDYLLKSPGPLSESDLKVANDRISGHLKEIKVSGFKDISGGSIPIYNEQGIVGGHYISSNKVYTYELSLPLSLIRPLINNNGTFNYKVQVNGMGNDVITIGGASLGSSAPSDNPAQPGPSYYSAPTYFNASYTLSKK